MQPPFPVILSVSIFNVGVLPFTCSAKIHFVPAILACEPPTLVLERDEQDAKATVANIDKKMFKTNESLTFLGFHNVEIELYKDVIATLKVQLVKEK